MSPAEEYANNQIRKLEEKIRLRILLAKEINKLKPSYSSTIVNNIYKLNEELNDIYKLNEELNDI
jgi:hypothetical protein